MNSKRRSLLGKVETKVEGGEQGAIEVLNGAENVAVLAVVGGSVAADRSSSGCTAHEPWLRSRTSPSCRTVLPAALVW